MVTPINVKEEARITAALHSTPSNVDSAIQTPSGTPEARKPSMSLDPDRRIGAQHVAKWHLRFLNGTLKG